MPATARNREHQLSVSDDGRMFLAITEGVRIRHTDIYKVEPMPSDFGAAFRLTKVQGRQRLGAMYWVCIEHVANGGRADGWCDCIGFERHGRCRHIEILGALVAEGVL